MVGFGKFHIRPKSDRFVMQQFIVNLGPPVVRQQVSGDQQMVDHFAFIMMHQGEPCGFGNGALAGNNDTLGQFIVTGILISNRNRFRTQLFKLPGTVTGRFSFSRRNRDFSEILTSILGIFATGKLVRILVYANPHFVQRFATALWAALGTGQVDFIGIEPRVILHEQCFDLVGLRCARKARKFQLAEDISG